MRQFSCLIALFTLTTLPVFAQLWQQLGPNGAAVAGLAGVPGYPDELYFATDGFPAHILRTTDAGLSWTVVETIPDQIAALATDPVEVRTIYAAGRTGRVWRSTDAGITWTLRGTMPGTLRVWNLVINPANRSELFAAAGQRVNDSTAVTLLHSMNSGQSWTAARMARTIQAAAPLLLLIPGQVPALYIGGSLEAKPCLLFTTDAGSSWTDLSVGLDGRCAYAAAVNPLDSTTLLCATDAGIYRSTDQGANWYRRLAAPCYSLKFSPASGYTGYAGSENLIYVSVDRGANWSAETTDFAGTLTRWLELNTGSALEAYAANARGVFRTTNRGFSWTELTGPMLRLTLPWLRCAPDSQTMFACPTGYGLLRSTNQGRTWTALREFPGSCLTTDLAVNPRNPDTLIAITATDSRLHLSIDRGDSWVHLPIASSFAPLGLTYHPQQPDTIYVWGRKRDSAGDPGRFRVYRSSDRGQSWTPFLTRGTVGACHGFDFYSSPETLFAWGETEAGPAIYWSTDRGANWLNRSTGITGPGPVRRLAVSPVDRRTIFCALPGGVYRSTDRGATWDNIGLANVSAVLPDTANVNALWAGTDTQGVWRTTNGGLFWDRDTIGATSRAVTFLRRHPADRSLIYCGTAGASILYRGSIPITESHAVHTQPLIVVSPSIVRDHLVIRFPSRNCSQSLSDRMTIDLFSTDGRRCCRIADLQNRPAMLRWHVPKRLGNGIYLLVARTALDQTTVRFCVTR